MQRIQFHVIDHTSFVQDVSWSVYFGEMTLDKDYGRPVLGGLEYYYENSDYFRSFDSARSAFR